MRGTLTTAEVEIGATLPELVLDLTPTMIISTALATRDFTPVHHDVNLARAQGSQDIFLNILTTMGLVQRYVTDWAGPEAVPRGIDVRLGVPAYAGDRLTFTGAVAGRDDDVLTIAVRGTVSLGPHAIATVRLALPK
jgi:acyl dehydratase